MAATVPVVELPDHRHALRIRCPDGKTGAGDAIHRIGMRAQRFVRAKVRAFGEQPGIHLL
ncbi:hypothetical protein D3C72_1951310 [compost metagenome]